MAIIKMFLVAFIHKNTMFTSTSRLAEVKVMDRRQMTLMLSDKEMSLLDQMAERRGMSKTALLRQALRLYQSVTERIDDGEKVFVEHPSTKDKTELMVL
jgi:Ribbon-helix-helix protein, copG family